MLFLTNEPAKKTEINILTYFVGLVLAIAITFCLLMLCSGVKIGRLMAPLPLPGENETAFYKENFSFES